MHVHTGDMPAMIRAHTWAETPLGPRDSWPHSLQTAVDMILLSAFPMCVVWGPEFRLLYNDAYAPILAERHPHALGRPLGEVWSDVWPEYEPLVTRAMGGETLCFANLEIELLRHGRRAKAWFTLSYSGLRGDDVAFAGALCVVHETTVAVLGERINRSQTGMLRQLFDEAPGFMAVLRGPQHVFEIANAAHRSLHRGRDVTGMTVAEAVPEAAAQGFTALLDQVRATGCPIAGAASACGCRRSA